VFVASGDLKAHATRRQLWTISEALVPHKHVFDFNQALMDFGATVCSARKPRCRACPMKKFCRSFASLSSTVPN
jgi:A/G-specific adenine glycosylase